MRLEIVMIVYIAGAIMALVGLIGCLSAYFLEVQIVGNVATAGNVLALGAFLLIAGLQLVKEDGWRIPPVELKHIQDAGDLFGWACILTFALTCVSWVRNYPNVPWEMVKLMVDFFVISAGLAIIADIRMRRARQFNDCRNETVAGCDSSRR